MMNSYGKFTPAKGRRQILIADDEIINREILGEMLRSEYDIIFACDGAETMEMIEKNQDAISLVLLDVLMPVMSGLEVLKKAKADPRYARIPFIVMTGEKDTEIESLGLGAIDFIPKPYPAPGVIKARIQRTIELMEDRDTIESTERDSLTGLYNKEFFYRYAQQMDRLNPEAPMDAVLLDISHFHIINERYGKSYGNEVLAKLGSRLNDLAVKFRGLACRRQADTFMLYLPHRDYYEGLMGTIVEALEEIDTGQNRIRLRMGVYPSVDKSVDMDLRFDRAKMAADTIKGKYTKNIGFYDEKFHQKQLYAEQLIVEFPTAIEEKQFQVYFQPKFSVVPEVPVLASAEALVRWVHPKLGMISPGEFIPLFEDNGLVQSLDRYVWEETARQIREWKDKLDCSIPVSVNVSRVDLFDSALPQKLQEILDKYGLTGADFLLEVTESAYTRDSAQIIRMVETLRDLGFRIEMDDFGTGYSSLHMISSLPIDALKLDMQFIRDAFSKGGNTHMLEVIIGIAEYLSVPVIAEGVETEEQLRALRSLGCDMVQGYFFSKPVPASDFEAFILQKKEADFLKRQTAEKSEADQLFEETAQLDDRPVEQLTAMYESRTREDARREVQKKEEQAKKDESSSGIRSVAGGIHLRTASLFFAIISIVLAAALMFMNISVTRGYQRMK
ncbi:MAG: EAL domain-containing protein, partial [Blautia sp.]|nr:EAL domain-containing protein [Blautia sp.]